MTNKIRVLIIDDSAFARKVIREVLQNDPAIEVVGIARDGLEGLEKIAELTPDIITLDLLMPDLDGLGVLRALPELGKPKVIIVSVSGSDTELGLEALQMGAIDIVAKPTPLPTDRLYDLSAELIFKVKAAAEATNLEYKKTNSSSPTTIHPEITHESEIDLVVIGTSTGGPQAITKLFAKLPANLNAVFAVALHIPEGYTASMAQRISLNSAMKLEEARDGMELIPGNAVIAPGGKHLKIRRLGEKLFAVVTFEPYNTDHHPSVNVLFESAAIATGKKTLGVILTGMGSDGTEGSIAIHKAGGKILNEAEASCIVYGMPRSVAEADISSTEILLDNMASAISRILE